MKRPARPFTQQDDDFIRANIDLLPSTKIAEKLGRIPNVIRGRYKKLGIAPSDAARAKFQESGRFKKGQASINKGVKMSPEVYEKVKGSFFKKGNKPFNLKTDGYRSVDSNGYERIKINGQFQFTHVYLWTNEHGPIPKDHIVIFIDGDKSNLQLSNLEVISKAEQAVRNRWVAKYPREIQRVEYLRMQLKQKIKNYGKK